MKIEISKEDLEFLEDLAHQLKTQDRRGTAEPVFYVVQSKERQPVPDGFSDKFYWYNSVDSETYDTEREVLKEYDSLGEFYRVFYKDVWKDEAVFLTEVAAQKHIDQNNYHYKEPRVYVKAVWRNPEVEFLLETVKRLGNKE